MKISKRFILATSLVASLGFVSTSWAIPLVDYGSGGLCPTTFGHSRAGSAGIGNATACNLVITFNADGSILTASGPQSTYENIEDALIGVVNNSGKAITSFNLDGGSTDIFDFDGDGINVYTFVGGVETDIAPVGSNTDTTGYGGFNAFFTNISLSEITGTVNFANGGILNGGSDFFSLERPAFLNLKVAPPTSSVPEPGVVLLLAFGLGIFGIQRRVKSSDTRGRLG